MQGIPGYRGAVMLTSAGEPIAALDRLALADPASTIDAALAAAEEVLGMEVVYLSELADGEQLIRSVRGDSGSFGIEEGCVIPLEQSYCARMAEGTLPNLIEDTSEEPLVNDLSATHERDIGSYVGVPLRLPDGRVYGTLCCASHEAHDELAERDVAFLRVLARVLGDHLANAGTAEAPVPSLQDRDGLLATLSLWFAGAPNAAAAARSALAALEEHLDGETAYQMQLVVTELLTNSVRHSGVGPAGSVGMDIRVAFDRVFVEISDPGPGFEPVVQEATPDDLDRTGGWGLLLVDELTDSWEVVHDELTRVRFEMSLRRAA